MTFFFCLNRDILTKLPARVLDVLKFLFTYLTLCSGEEKKNRAAGGLERQEAELSCHLSSCGWIGNWEGDL